MSRPFGSNWFSEKVKFSDINRVSLMRPNLMWYTVKHDTISNKNLDYNF